MNRSHLLGLYACSVLSVLAFGCAFVAAQDVDLSPGILKFSPQVVGTTSPGQNVILTDTGTIAIKVTRTLGSGDFAATNDCGSRVVAGGTCTITVSFTPSAPGTIRGVITVDSTAPDSPQLVSVSGTGITPVTLRPPGLNFGTVAIGTISGVKTVTVTNNQGTTLSTLGFASNGDYTTTPGGATPCGASLAANAFCTLNVTFAPSNPGSTPGAVTVTHSAAYSPQTVPLAGVGSGTSNPPLLISPTSLNFGNVVVGTTSAGQTVTVKDPGTEAQLAIFSASGNYAAVGSGTSPCTGFLYGNTSCTLTVTMSPTLTGTLTGDLAVVNTNQSGSPQTVGLMGVGTSPVQLSPSTLSFLNQKIGTTSGVQVITLTNHQSTPLTIDSIVASGDYSIATPGSSSCRSSVAANSKCTIGVTFNPNTLGLLPGAVTVNYAGAGSPQAISLTGSVQAVARFLYSAFTNNPGQGLINEYTIDATTGLLRPFSTLFVNTFSLGVALVHPSGEFLYAVDMGGDVLGYSVNLTTGKLTPMPGSPFTGGTWFALAGVIEPTGRFLYTTSSSDDGVNAYAIDPVSGALTLVIGSPFAAGSYPDQVAVDPLGRFLYVVNVGLNNNANIYAYTINQVDGSLTTIPGSPYSPGEVEIDPTGQYAYVFGYPSSLYVFSINQKTGAWTGVSGSPFPLQGASGNMTLDPTGRFLYFSYGSAINGYSINASTHAPTLIPGSPFASGSSPGQLQVDPSGQFAFVACEVETQSFLIDQVSGALTLLETSPTRMTYANYLSTVYGGTKPLTYTPAFAYVANAGSNTVSMYTISPLTGVLTAGTTIATGNKPVSVASDLYGRYVYVANSTSNDISAYTINQSTGALAAISGSPFGNLDIPIAVQVDSSGQNLFAVNNGSASIAEYDIEAGGVLRLRTSTAYTGSGPSGFAFRPAGGAAYVPDAAGITVSSFLTNENGSLAPYGRFQMGTKPVAVAADSSGQYVYVANQGSNNISGGLALYAGLTVPGSPFAAGTAPSAIVAHPLSPFLYVANAGSNNVSGYTIDPATGSLTEMVGSPFGAGSGPSALNIDVSGKYLYVTNSQSNNVSAYSINSATGALTGVAGSPFGAGANPTSIVTTWTIQ